ncbi:hypothetical protein HNQ60_004327 [Povalibacter uvarum]|uniref:MxaD family protein n=1 Tax=Povalibacter uvarum TaxID=732238 RepID=A0A841HQE9_9GAMM|nr:SRPBCC family protein [Povalibacter uvarum]MBB6095437.1 hypothetical protein [Povalibacter uvarum]
MATIRKEFTVQANADEVWAAFRDVGAIHTRLARDFVTDCQLDGTLRTVTFANGLVAKERIVTIDDAAHRLVYSVVEGKPTHHNGSFEVIREGADRSHVIWIADLLPDEIAGAIGQMMELGSHAMKKTLDDAGS